jgi:hypothetical protein
MAKGVAPWLGFKRPKTWMAGAGFVIAFQIAGSIHQPTWPPFPAPGRRPLFLAGHSDRPFSPAKPAAAELPQLKWGRRF